MLRQQKKAKATADVKLIGECGSVYLCINDTKKKKSS